MTPPPLLILSICVSNLVFIGTWGIYIITGNELFISPTMCHLAMENRFPETNLCLSQSLPILFGFLTISASPFEGENLL